MGRVGVSAARSHLSELLDRVAKGEAITITRRGEPVARLVPVAPLNDPQRARSAIAALRRARRGVRLDVRAINELRRDGSR